MDYNNQKLGAICGCDDIINLCNRTTRHPVLFSRRASSRVSLPQGGSREAYEIYFDTHPNSRKYFLFNDVIGNYEYNDEYEEDQE